jgi:hypothetical protein
MTQSLAQETGHPVARCRARIASTFLSVRIRERIRFSALASRSPNCGM